MHVAGLNIINYTLLPFLNAACMHAKEKKKESPRKVFKFLMLLPLYITFFKILIRRNRRKKRKICHRYIYSYER